MNILVLIFLILALVCFAVAAVGPASRINLDQAGKAALVAALIANLYGG